MGKRHLLFILMLGSLVYAVYTYWPVVKPYLTGEATRQPTLEEMMKKFPAGKPPLPAAPRTAVKEEVPAAPAPKPKVVVKTTTTTTVLRRLVDPFALRIAVRSKQEAADAAQRAAEAAAEKKKAQVPTGPKLEGIWVGSGIKAAFISGQVVTEGGYIMGWRVATIYQTSVLLRRGNATRLLKLGGE